MTDAKPKNKTVAWILGCSVLLLLVGGLCAGGAWYAFGRLQDYVWETVLSGSVSGLEDIGLAGDEITAIRGDLDRLREAHRSGEITLEDLGDLAKEVFEGPLLFIGVVEAFEVKALPKLPLSPAEQEVAKRDLARFQHGLRTNQISLQRAEEIFFAIDDLQRPEGVQADWIHNQTDIEAALTAMRQAVEEAGIPDDAEPLKLSEEFGLRVDELLAR